MARGETAEIDVEDQQELFPELDLDKPAHKALYLAAKRHAKLKGERATLLTTSKEKVENAAQKVIDQMHELKLKKFKHRGVKATIIQTREKVEVQIEDEDAEPADEE